MSKKKNLFIKTVIILASLSSTNALQAQSLYPGMFESRYAIADKSKPKVEWFRLNQIRLLPSRFQENMTRDSAWMMSIPVNTILHGFRNQAGLYTGNEGGYFYTKKMGGWESLDCDLRGHAVGHLLSAYALMYAQTGDSIFRVKGDSIVKGLAEVQKALGASGYLSAFPENLINRSTNGQSVWAPWYTLHKILAGLIDQYLYAENGQALSIAKRMSNWAYQKLAGLDSTSLSTMIRYEYGGINESFYNMYSLTGDSRYYHLATLFYRKDNMDPLKRQENPLGTLHANTFIPKVLAEARKYEITSEPSSETCSKYFSHLITSQYSFVNGEIGDHEHFFNPEETEKHLTGYDGEGCCTYNMLKLCRHIFSWTADESIMDYYECALYNHILGQQDPESGMVCYFTPMQSGAFKVYSTPNNSYWCCVGTAFESNAKYGESIYAHDEDGIYINLFIPSKLNWEEKGWEICQTTDFPQDGKITIVMGKTPEHPASLHLRCPQWSGKPLISINNRTFKGKVSPGSYLAIKRKWRRNDTIKISLPMNVSLCDIPNHKKFAVKYGPVVMAQALGRDGIQAPAPFSDPSKYNDYYRYDFHLPSMLNDGTPYQDFSCLKKTSKQLMLTSPKGITLIPLFDIHRQRYIVYWNR